MKGTRQGELAVRMDIAKFERGIIQDILHKQQDIRYKNYGWTLALTSAISVAAISGDSSVPGYLYLLLVLGIISWSAIFDLFHRSEFYRLVERSAFVEQCMRVSMTEYDGPLVESTLVRKDFDPRAIRDTRFLAHYSLLYSIGIGVYVYVSLFK